MNHFLRSLFALQIIFPLCSKGGWIVRFLEFYEMKRHPKEMGTAEIERFLSHLATHDNVASSTQRQALNAIMFLYREVLHIELGDIGYMRSKRTRRPPTVLTQKEIQQLLLNVEGTHRLMTQLLYGCGLRLRKRVGCHTMRHSPHVARVGLLAAKERREGERRLCRVHLSTG